MFRLARLQIVLLLSLVLASFAPLPAAAQPASSPTSADRLSPTAATVGVATIGYIVVPGDTLAGIAARFATTVPAILDANPQISNANDIYAGEYVEIPVAGIASAERINFARGGTSATRQDWVAAGTPKRYVFRAGAGQVAQIDVFGNGGGATMAIRGANGRVVLSQNAGLASFRAPLPSTQDYFIDVYAASGPPVNYTLQLIIPQRIRFPWGAVSTSLPGFVPSNGTHNYILRAAAGQLMTVNVRSAGQVILIIYGNDGSVLQTDHVGSSSFSGRLPYTEDYFLDVRSVSPTGANYQLDVRITY